MKDAVTEILNVVFRDLHVRLSGIDVRMALIADNSVPTDEEITLLVTGDENGDVPAQLIGRFMNLRKLIFNAFN